MHQFSVGMSETRSGADGLLRQSGKAIAYDIAKSGKT